MSSLRQDAFVLQPRQLWPPFPVDAQVRPMAVQSTRQAPQWRLLVMLTQEFEQQTRPLPQLFPLATDRVQLRLPLEVSLRHEPPPQVRVVTVRDWVPVASQASPKPPQLPQLPKVVEPQLTPSRSRVQLRVSVVVVTEQAPASHTGVITGRD